MMFAHATSQDLQRYVLDTLAPAAKELLEDHVQDCLPCARRLGEEAALELQLQAAWSELREPRAEILRLPLVVPPPRRPARVTAGRRGSSGFAAAAVAFMIFGWLADGSRGARPPTVASSAPQACFSPGFSAAPERPAICRPEDAAAMICDASDAVCAPTPLFSAR